MKRLILMAIMLVSLFTIQAQTDVVYPEDGGEVINQCTITEIMDKNFVVYEKDGKTFSLRAYRVAKGGVTINLLNDKTNPFVEDTDNVDGDIEHYQALYEKYSQKKKPE